MDRVTAIRWLSLYLPAVAVIVLGYLRPGGRRLFGATLVGVAWTLPSLLGLQSANLHFGWWTFHARGGLIRGMPVDLWLGWTVLWGAVPTLAVRRLKIVWVATVLFGLDLVLMPACWPVVELHGHWLIGEVLALTLVLIPAQLLARWTLHDAHLYGRAALQVVMTAALFLFLLPEIVFALRTGRGWSALLSNSTWVRNLELQAVGLLGILGISAVQEFAERGRGTPIPYDPPKRLVTSGVYRYVANPMQFSCAMVLTAWGAVLRNPWVATAGLMSFLYGAGLANWDEGEDLQERFGQNWKNYREGVHAWRFRFTPWHDPSARKARLYVAETCGPCSEVRRWFEAHHAVGLEIVAAEDHPTRDLRRITYDAMDGSEPDEGVRAFARGVEHIHLGWALAGAALRLPVLSHFVQLLMDASGLGPQRIPRRSCPPQVSAGEESPSALH
ncbi:MAG TPA: methyltransferase [Candidatus Nitrosotalea sp.]|nr:methyltransferase [Candidatus Nitrosotalea sp.]